MVYQRIRAIIMRKRGQNLKLLEEIKEKLTPEAKLRLLRVLEEMEMETDAAKRKLRRNSFLR